MTAASSRFQGKWKKGRSQTQPVGEGVDGELKGGEGADVEVEPVEGPPEEGVLL
jgi:hypothetical protein